MDVYDIRVNFTDLLNQFFRGASGYQAVCVKQPCCQIMEEQVKSITGREQLRGMLRDAVASSAIGDITVPSCGHGEFAKFAHNPPGRCVLSDDGIDLEQFFRHG